MNRLHNRDYVTYSYTYLFLIKVALLLSRKINLNRKNVIINKISSYEKFTIDTKNPTYLDSLTLIINIHTLAP